MEKEEVSSALKKLERVGWKLYNFNSKKPMPTGAIGWCDYVLVHSLKGVIVFLEAKITKPDERRGLSKEQKEFADVMLEFAMHNGKAMYFNVTEGSFLNTVERIALI